MNPLQAPFSRLARAIYRARLTTDERSDIIAELQAPADAINSAADKKEEGEK